VIIFFQTSLKTIVSYSACVDENLAALYLYLQRLFNNLNEERTLHVIRRGLRALGDREFPMPSNTAVRASSCKELAVDVVETMPPQKKNYFQK